MPEQLASFIGEGLTEELLSGIVLGTAALSERKSEAGEASAARLFALTAARRFDMCWMFVGAREKAAVTAVLGAVRSTSMVEKAAQRYGVQLSQ